MVPENHEPSYCPPEDPIFPKTLSKETDFPSDLIDELVLLQFNTDVKEDSKKLIEQSLDVTPYNRIETKSDGIRINDSQQYGWYKINNTNIQDRGFIENAFKEFGDRIINLSPIYRHIERTEIEERRWFSLISNKFIIILKENLEIRRKQEIANAISEDLKSTEFLGEAEFNLAVSKLLYKVMVFDVKGEGIVDTAGIISWLNEKVKASQNDEIYGSIKEVNFDKAPIIDPTSAIGTDPKYPSEQEYLLCIRADEKTDIGWKVGAWDFSRGNRKVKIAILDRGIPRHEDLSYNPIDDGFHITVRDPSGDPAPDGNVESLNSYLTSPPPLSDNQKHGIQVAGVALATMGNNIGIRGLASKCQLFSVGLDFYSTCEIAEAIAVALNDKKVKVLNMSFGIDSNLSYAAIDAQLESPKANRVVMCAASGNNSLTDPVDYPAAHPNVMACGGARCTLPTESGQKVNYQKVNNSRYKILNARDRRTGISVVAPGYTNETTDMDISSGAVEPYDDYSARGGTSFASPLVAALAALMFSINSRLKPHKIREAIENTCVKNDAYHLDPAGNPIDWNEKVGYGLINAYEACKWAYKSRGFPYNLSDDLLIPFLLIRRPFN